MRIGVRGRRQETGGEDWWPAFTLRWPRRVYRVVAEPTGRDGAHWSAHLPKRRVPFFDAQPSSPWTYDRRETPERGSAIYGYDASRIPSAAETINVYRLMWPPGGIFVPVGGGAPEEYDPLSAAPEILLDVQRTAAKKDAEALLGFVNRWGVLGVGIPGADDFPLDGVQQTAAELRELARWIAVVHDLQARRRRAETWTDVAATFGERLAGVHLQAQVAERSRLLPSFHVPRLIDGLYLELWDVATGGKRLRRCKRCEDFFVRGRQDQIFCTPRCARLWHVKRWKQAHREQRHPARPTRQRKG
jgi:hypothetical protein